MTLYLSQYRIIFPLCGLKEKRKSQSHTHFTGNTNHYNQSILEKPQITILLLVMRVCKPFHVIIGNFILFYSDFDLPNTNNLYVCNFFYILFYIYIFINENVIFIIYSKQTKPEDQCIICNYCCHFKLV